MFACTIAATGVLMAVLTILMLHVLGPVKVILAYSDHGGIALIPILYGVSDQVVLQLQPENNDFVIGSRDWLRQRQVPRVALRFTYWKLRLLEHGFYVTRFGTLGKRSRK
jgi:hypothetical protein